MPTLSLPDGGPAEIVPGTQWRMLWRQWPRLAWAGVLITTAVLWATIVWKLPVHGAPAVPWWLLAPAFLAAEVWPARLRLRAEWESARIWAAPLAVGLFFSTPLDLLAGFVAGALLGAVIRWPRHPARALAVATRAGVAVAVAELFFTGLAPPGSSQWLGWLAVAVAVAVATA
ncbi:MAG: hypothetical protein ACREN2_03470, partial [Candidatus Dormibacteria bacterium]